MTEAGFLSKQAHLEEFPLVSLFNESFSIDWLMDLTEIKVSRILSMLQNEVRNGVLEDQGNGLYRFIDMKRKQAIQKRLADHEKQSYHRRIANVLEKHGSDEETMLKKAWHLIHVPNDVDGCRWLMKAVKSCQRSYRPKQAIQFCTKIIEDLSNIEGEEADNLLIEAALSLSKNSSGSVKPAKVISILKKASLRAEKRSDSSLKSLIEMNLAKNEWFRNKESQSLKHFEKGIALAADIDDEKLNRSILSFKIWFYYWFGQFSDAVSEYRKHTPDIDRYSMVSFHKLTNIILGNCLIYTGFYSQGVGLINTQYNHCMKIGDTENAALAEIGLGFALTTIRKPDEALPYFQNALTLANKINNNWAKISAYQNLSVIYYLNNQIDKSCKFQKKWLKAVRSIGMSTYFQPIQLEILWAMEKGNYPRISGLKLEDEVNQLLEGRNILAKGVAYRYLSFIQQSQGLADHIVGNSLISSFEHLKHSGHQTELALTCIELARRYLRKGNQEKAATWINFSENTMSEFDQSLIPDDLKSLIDKQLTEKNLLNEILALGHEVISIREVKELVNNILATANRLAGAERGAIFMMDKGNQANGLFLRAAKNLTAEDIHDPAFERSMQAIEKTARSKQGQIWTTDIGSPSSPASRSRIQSGICVPMILRGDTVGVLYHDNRLIPTAFKERHLEVLSYFAALVAIAIDNAQAYDDIKVLNEKLEEEKKIYEDRQLDDIHSEEIIGESKAIKRVIANIEKVADSDTTVLILGETGVGKDLVASAIHRRSRRRDHPFVKVHCSSLSESMMISELFGHEEGAFSGATSRRIGRLELVDGGTLFLDEIGELSLQVQGRLLRLLQTGEFERVGNSRALRTDIRLAVATNQNLAESVNSGRFRKDLYYRLSVFPIKVPALRERIKDVPGLAYHFLKIYSDKLGKSVSRITQPIMERLMSYEWSGNVRELENVIERGVILSTDSVFRMPELDPIQANLPVLKEFPSMEENERALIIRAIKLTGGKINGKGGAAELLKINRNTLYYRMKKLNIDKKALLKTI